MLGCAAPLSPWRANFLNSFPPALIIFQASKHQMRFESEKTSFHGCFHRVLGGCLGKSKHPRGDLTAAKSKAQPLSGPGFELDSA